MLEEVEREPKEELKDVEAYLFEEYVQSLCHASRSKLRSHYSHSDKLFSIDTD